MYYLKLFKVIFAIVFIFMYESPIVYCYEYDTPIFQTGPSESSGSYEYVHPISGKQVSVDYDIIKAKEYKNAVIHLDHHNYIYELKCGKDYLEFKASKKERQLLLMLKQSKFIVGGIVNRCSDGIARTLILRILSYNMKELSDSKIEISMEVETAHYNDILEKMKVSFRSHALTHGGGYHKYKSTYKQLVHFPQQQRIENVGWFGSSLWHSVTHFVHKIVHIAEEVVNGIKILIWVITGDFPEYDHTWKFDGLYSGNVKANFTNSSSHTNTSIVTTISGSVLVEGSVSFDILVDKYKLQHVKGEIDGNLSLNMEADIHAAWKLHLLRDVNDWKSKKITFSIAGIPFVLQFQGSVYLGLNITASTEVRTSKYVTLNGPITWGFHYQQGDSGPKWFHHLPSVNVDKSSSLLESVNFTDNLDVIPYIRFDTSLVVDKILAFTVIPETGISAAITVTNKPIDGCFKRIGAQFTLGWVVNIGFGLHIHIKFIKTWDKSWEWFPFHLHGPILAKCVSFDYFNPNGSSAIPRPLSAPDTWVAGHSWRGYRSAVEGGPVINASYSSNQPFWCNTSFSAIWPSFRESLLVGNITHETTITYPFDNSRSCTGQMTAQGMHQQMPTYASLLANVSLVSFTNKKTDAMPCTFYSIQLPTHGAIEPEGTYFGGVILEPPNAQITCDVANGYNNKISGVQFNTKTGIWEACMDKSDKTCIYYNGGYVLPLTCCGKSQFYGNYNGVFKFCRENNLCSSFDSSAYGTELDALNADAKRMSMIASKVTSMDEFVNEMGRFPIIKDAKRFHFKKKKSKNIIVKPNNPSKFNYFKRFGTDPTSLGWYPIQDCYANYKITQCDENEIYNCANYGNCSTVPCCDPAFGCDSTCNNCCGQAGYGIQGCVTPHGCDCYDGFHNTATGSCTGTGPIFTYDDDKKCHKHGASGACYTDPDCGYCANAQGWCAAGNFYGPFYHKCPAWFPGQKYTAGVSYNACFMMDETEPLQFFLQCFQINSQSPAPCLAPFNTDYTDWLSLGSYNDCNAFKEEYEELFNQGDVNMYDRVNVYKSISRYVTNDLIDFIKVQHQSGSNVTLSLLINYTNEIFEEMNDPLKACTGLDPLLTKWCTSLVQNKRQWYISPTYQTAPGSLAQRLLLVLQDITSSNWWKTFIRTHVLPGPGPTPWNPTAAADSLTAVFVTSMNFPSYNSTISNSAILQTHIHHHGPPGRWPASLGHGIHPHRP